MWDSPNDDEEARRPPMPSVPGATTTESAPLDAPRPESAIPLPTSFDSPPPAPAAAPTPTDTLLGAAAGAPSPPAAADRAATHTVIERSPFALTPPQGTYDSPNPNLPGGLSARPEPVDAPAPPPRRRMWPLVLLALLTVAASGAVSWFVASSVDDSETVVEQPTATSTTEQPSAQPAVVDSAADQPDPAPVGTVASVEVFGDEPFAAAAQAIAPSVVQLTLGSGLGTGVIIDSDGTILTAAHVVGNESDVRVTFSDGSSVDGTVVGTHAPTDVAVVMVDPAGRELVPAPLADGDSVQVGQLAVAVGSPFGFDQTVTAGIISAVDRVVNSVSMVQTDAPINPGNSGGPLINLSGEVVGINDLIFTESGSNAGVGFAISIDLAMIVAEQIIAGDDVQLALLGVSTNQPLNGEAGAQVAEVVAGSAAESAGVEVGDIVVGVDGDPTRGSSELRAQVIDNSPGTVITLDVIRSGDRIQLEATLGQTGG